MLIFAGDDFDVTEDYRRLKVFLLVSILILTCRLAQVGILRLFIGGGSLQLHSG